MGDVAGTLRAADALQFGTRNALISHISRISSVLLLTGSSMSIFVSLPICTSDETEAMSHRGSIFMKSLAIFYHAFVFSVIIEILVRIPHLGPYSACFEEIVLEVPILSAVLHGGWQFGIAAAVFIMIAAISDSISRIVLMRYPHHLLRSWARGKACFLLRIMTGIIVELSAFGCCESLLQTISSSSYSQQPDNAWSFGQILSLLFLCKR